MSSPRSTCCRHKNQNKQKKYQNEVVANVCVTEADAARILEELGGVPFPDKLYSVNQIRIIGINASEEDEEEARRSGIPGAVAGGKQNNTKRGK